MKKTLFAVALLLCIGVFGFSSVTLAKRYIEKNQNQNQMDALAAMMEEAADREAENLAAGNDPYADVGQNEDAGQNADAGQSGVAGSWMGNTDEGMPTRRNRLANPKAVAKLREQNDDLIGWLSIDGTKINYPVMHTPEDGEFYLKRGFDKQYSSYGLPFLDASCDLDTGNRNLLIYGHHMKDGSMFANLLSYEKKDFYQSHSVIHFDTEDGIGDYQIIGAFKRSAVDVEEDFLTMLQADTPERYADFINYVKTHSFYDTGIDAEFGENLLTLMTCEYSQTEGRFFVVAKKRAEK